MAKNLAGVPDHKVDVFALSGGGDTPGGQLGHEGIPLHRPHLEAQIPGQADGDCGVAGAEVQPSSAGLQAGRRDRVANRSP